MEEVIAGLGLVAIAVAAAVVLLSQHLLTHGMGTMLALVGGLGLALIATGQAGRFL